MHKLIYKNSQSFVDAQANELRLCHPIHVLHGLIQSNLPSCEFSWRVQVVRLLIYSELELRVAPELDHKPCQSFPTSFVKLWLQLHHAAIKRSVNLAQRFRTWVVYQDNWCMSQKTVGERIPPRIGWRIARTQELYALYSDPLPVGRTVKSILLSNLTDEHDHALGTILVLLWKVDLVTEDNEPTTRLLRSHNYSICSLHELTIQLECF
mmetsp:Transcript_117777/g.216783  ORF Transcript_117777/g.216783 Transcript_117777/m.216783 type:complete len:209 (+) Transcript_117777:189-815(+)